MRRLLLPLLAACVLIPLSGAANAKDKTPVLDGKKTTYVSVQIGAARGVPAPQGPTDAQVLSCTPTTCARMPFIYSPAKGVPRDLGLSLGWYYEASSRLDLFLVGPGNKILVRCGSRLGNTRRVVVPATQLKPGAVYTAVAFYDYSVTADVFTLAATLPAVKRGQGLDTSDPFNLKYASCSD